VRASFTRPLLGALTVALLVGCHPGARAARADEGKPKESVEDRALLDAFRDTIYAYYDFHRLGRALERARAAKRGISEETAAQTKAALRRVSEQERGARERLALALGKPKTSPLKALLGAFRGRLGARHDLALIPFGKVEGVESLKLVRGKALVERAMPSLGDDFALEFMLYDEVLVQDYAVYRRRGKGTPLRRPLQVLERRVYIDRAVVAELGRQGLWAEERQTRYRRLATEGEQLKSFMGMRSKPLALMIFMKDLLRWRALKSLATSGVGKTAVQRDGAFVSDFVGRTLLQAALEIREKERFRARESRLPRGRDELSAVYQRALWGTMAAGEPLGALGTIFGIAVQGMSPVKPGAGRPTAPPQVTAARRIVLRCLEVSRAPAVAGEDKELRDARALYALSRAPAEDLRSVARKALGLK